MKKIFFSVFFMYGLYCSAQFSISLGSREFTINAKHTGGYRLLTTNFDFYATITADSLIYHEVLKDAEKQRVISYDRYSVALKDIAFGRSTYKTCTISDDPKHVIVQRYVSGKNLVFINRWTYTEFGEEFGNDVGFHFVSDGLFTCRMYFKNMKKQLVKR